MSFSPAAGPSSKKPVQLGKPSGTEDDLEDDVEDEDDDIEDDMEDDANDCLDETDELNEKGDGPRPGQQLNQEKENHFKQRPQPKHQHPEEKESQHLKKQEPSEERHSPDGAATGITKAPLGGSGCPPACSNVTMTVPQAAVAMSVPDNVDLLGAAAVFAVSRDGESLEVAGPMDEEGVEEKRITP